jgi:ATP-dependent DNA helicase PIF1
MISLTQKQESALCALKSGKSVFLTGPGGTGKSFLLKHFIEWYKNERETDNMKIYVTSTTGLSSTLIEGMTLHRYAGIGLGEGEVDEMLKKINKLPHIKKRWKNTGILIIDEISMLDGDLFDKLEILSKKVRKNNLPFGGIQIILSGDFLQLPPVKASSFCFEAFSWDVVINETFYFDEIIRQKSNFQLQSVLNKVRLGIVDEDVRYILDSCLNKELKNKDGIIETLLFSRKNMVNEYNKAELTKLVESGAENYVFRATYEFGKKINEAQHDYLKSLVDNNFQVDNEITFAKNNQVMLIVNMPELGLANGSRGIITEFIKYRDHVNPVVVFLNGVRLEIQAKDFSLDEDGAVVKKIQVPLIHSWAITIHKAQGMSLEFIRTDIGGSVFEYGQAYVVLSRIIDIEGLSLINVDYSKIKAHPKILKYYKSLGNI